MAWARLGFSAIIRRIAAKPSSYPLMAPMVADGAQHWGQRKLLNRVMR